jgi:hypothetical protein
MTYVSEQDGKVIKSDVYTPQVDTPATPENSLTATPTPTLTPTPSPDLSNKTQKAKVVLSRFVKDNTKITKTKDDTTLVDVHVGNPLHKITLLLEEIKKQKAFTFDIKGSLGLAGVVLVLTSFGFFGGTKALCAKGVQSHIGSIKTLEVLEENNTPTLLQRAADAWNVLFGVKISQSEPHSRIVLVKDDHTVLHVVGVTPKNISGIQNVPVVVTGEFDSCNQEVTVKDAKAIQSYY